MCSRVPGARLVGRLRQQLQCPASLQKLNMTGCQRLRSGSDCNASWRLLSRSRVSHTTHTQQFSNTHISNSSENGSEAIAKPHPATVFSVSVVWIAFDHLNSAAHGTHVPPLQHFSKVDKMYHVNARHQHCR